MSWGTRWIGWTTRFEWRSFLQQKAPHLAFFGLILTVVLGLMNVVHILTYLKPTDGAHYQQDAGRLKVVSTDLSAETSLQVGDFLLAIDDTEIRDIQDYEDFIYALPLGSKHLYQLERNGSRYEPWVEIRGIKEIASEYYLFALSGFGFLLFIFIIWNQETHPYPKRSLVFACFAVFLAFVFHHTQRLSPLDWVSYYLDSSGRFLLPSAFLSFSLFCFPGLRDWRGFLQVLHWAPTLVMAVIVLLLFPQNTGVGASFSDEEYYRLLQEVQRVWGGLLLILAFVLALFGKKPGPGRQLVFALGCWLPFALDLLHLEFPYAWVWSALLPLLFPVVVLTHLIQKDTLHVEQFGKKGLVYFCVVLILFVTYFAFIRVFQSLLGGAITRDGQIFLSGFAIVFAAVSYGPLRNLLEELFNRLLYGERFHAMRALTDLSGVNQPSTDLNTFLSVILHRVQSAFGYDHAWAYVAGEKQWIFHALGQDKPVFELEQDLPAHVIAADFLAMHQIPGLRVFHKDEPGLSPSNWFWPLRVAGNVRCFLVLPGGPQDQELNLEEKQLLRSLLNQSEILLENMDLYRSLELKAQSFSQLKEFNENIIESSKLGMLATDEMDCGVSCNAAFCEIVGKNKDYVIGKPFGDLLVCVEIQNERLAKSGHAVEGYYRNLRQERVLLDILKTPLKTKDNEIFGNLYLVEDISEKRKLQDQLMQQEKLASIGLLAAGVAHEINTPLTGIASYSQLLQNEPDLGIESKELVKLIQEQSHRAANIVKELLNFSRKENLPKGP
ncbi:MAG: PAS domain S-box protein, partial [Acidobacteria bacterium]|nr:PAS domain S-box protein [Acidobacteriota bacterium]